MRRILPLAIIGVVALAGCASAGGPAETSAPAPETPAPTVTETVTPAPTESATPAPSDSDDDAAAVRIEDEAVLGRYSLDDLPGDGEPLVVWANADRTEVHVIGAGSSSADCTPTGESAEVDDGMLELDFSWPDRDDDMPVACTADLRIFGWSFPVSGADDSITQANVDEWTEDGDDIVVDIQPASEPS